MLNWIPGGVKALELWVIKASGTGMMNLKQNVISKLFNTGFELLLSASSKKRTEKFVLIIAITSYLIHLLLIFLSNKGLILVSMKFLQSPISAIYTPFSFILVYEVYLLIFYLPKSTTLYIGKQYEIITLIIIRRIFKDIGSLEFGDNWFNNVHDLQFTYDVVTSLLLFLLIFFYYHKTILRRKNEHEPIYSMENTNRFFLLKKGIAFLLVPVLVLLAVYSFFNWAGMMLDEQNPDLGTLANVNNIFFDEFFTILIVVDVLLLLASFFYSDLFHTIMRNSGFVLSTILLKISFSVPGILNNALIIGSVLFGLLILNIHQLFEKAILTEEEKLEKKNT